MESACGMWDGVAALLISRYPEVGRDKGVVPEISHNAYEQKDPCQYFQILA